MTTRARMLANLNRVAKWRSVLAGWQLGTRADTDGEVRAVRDHREATLMLRIELTALTRALLEAGVIVEDRYQALVAEEAVEYDALMRKRFPGFRATDHGMQLDGLTAAATMREYGFPP